MYACVVRFGLWHLGFGLDALANQGGLTFRHSSESGLGAKLKGGNLSWEFVKKAFLHP